MLGTYLCLRADRASDSLPTEMIRAAIQGIASLRDGLDWREVAVEVQARMSDDAGFMCSAQGVRRLNGDIRSRGLRLDQAERGVQWRQMAFASEAVLTALDTYLSRGGGSRGARAICDPDGSDVPITRAGPLKAFRFRAERKQHRAETIAIRFENGAFTCSFQSARRHEHTQAVYFERGWAEFLFTRQVRGRTLRMALHSKASQLARSEGSELGVLTSDRNACKTGQLTILNRQRVSNSIILPFN